MTEHIAELSQDEKNRLFNWLRYGTGPISFHQVTFESVAHGGIFVRTQEYRTPRAGGNGELRTHFHNKMPGQRTLCGLVAGGRKTTDDCSQVTCGRCRIVSRSLGKT